MYATRLHFHLFCSFLMYNFCGNLGPSVPRADVSILHTLQNLLFKNICWVISWTFTQRVPLLNWPIKMYFPDIVMIFCILYLPHFGKFTVCHQGSGFYFSLLKLNIWSVCLTIYIYLRYSQRSYNSCCLFSFWNEYDLFMVIT